MDFLDDLASTAPVAQEFTFNGTTGTIWLKRITAGQKLQLVKGKRYNYNTGEGAPQTLEIDLEDNERNTHLVVSFCVVREDGTPRFKTAADVQKLDAALVAALYQAASKFNEPPDAGEA
jgi:hypothetical protein